MSTPASSCSLTANSVASRLARASSAPLDFQGAHSVLGSASHSGFGSEPAIVVGKSIDMSPGFLIWALSATTWARGTYGLRRGWPGQARPRRRNQTAQRESAYVMDAPPSQLIMPG